MKTNLFFWFILIGFLTNCNSPNNSKSSYTPIGLRIENGYRKWQWASTKQFESFTVTLANRTSEDFQMVKYRIILYVNEDGTKREIFSKSFEYYQRLNAGDIIQVTIAELAGYYMGVDVSKNENWSFAADIEDAKPIK